MINFFSLESLALKGDDPISDSSSSEAATEAEDDVEPEPEPKPMALETPVTKGKFTRNSIKKGSLDQKSNTVSWHIMCNHIKNMIKRLIVALEFGAEVYLVK